MSVQKLFNVLENHTKNTDDVFKESGMKNKFRELDFGFFPLGNGVLTENFNPANDALETCRIMVLGNDFGTLEYLNTTIPERREKTSNPTIKNLLTLLHLDTKH